MPRALSNLKRAVLVFVTATAVGIGAASFAHSQDKDRRPTQTAGVDNGKMGAYRALAELTYQAFEKGDNATAAKLARILERTWDKGEEGGGERSLAKTNAELFEQTDEAMDAFIKPLIGYEKSLPDRSKVDAAYHVFLEKLKQAD